MYAYLMVQVRGLLEPENIEEFAVSSSLHFSLSGIVQHQFL
jgi:hypothetical protein